MSSKAKSESGRSSAGVQSLVTPKTEAPPAKKPKRHGPDDEDFPLRKCGYCDRDSRCTNPCPRRHKGDTLKFANETQCLCCRNFINGPLKGTQAKVIRESLKNATKKQEYKQKLSEWEAKFDDGTIQSCDGKALCPSWLNSIEEQSAQSKKLLDNWWPKSALDREGVAYDEATLVPHEGETEAGLFRDAKFTPVSGCIIGTVAKTKKLLKGVELASSSTAVYDDEVAAMYARLSAATGSVEVSVDSQGVVQCTSAGPGGTAEDSDQDSWDDVLPTFVPTSCAPPETDDPKARDDAAGESKKLNRRGGKTKAKAKVV